MAQTSIDGCNSAGVTLLRGGRAIPVVATGDTARELDLVQCRAGHGPCLDAIRQLQVFNVADAALATSWPDFSRAAMAKGVRSSLSVPLTVGGDALGAMNLYGELVDAFTGLEAAAVVFAVEAASTLSGALPREPEPHVPGHGPRAHRVEVQSAPALSRREDRTQAV